MDTKVFLHPNQYYLLASYLSHESNESRRFTFSRQGFLYAIGRSDYLSFLFGRPIFSYF
jgi:hypothetical protein